MASQRITRVDVFPEGTTVTAYLLSNWPQASRPPAGAPLGASSGSAVMTNGAATISGLLGNTDYVAYALVTGEHRYVGFKTGPSAGDDGRPGLMFPTGNVGQARNAVLHVANRGFLLRGRPKKDITISQLTMIVTIAATNDDPVDVGIYDSAWNRLVSSGAVLGKMNAGTGRKSIPITPTLLKADTDYYVAMSYGAVGGTAATTYCVSLAAVTLVNLWGAGAGLAEGDVKNAVHPLPASWGAAGGVGSQFAAPLLEE